MTISTEDRNLADAVRSTAQTYAEALATAANAGLEITQVVAIRSVVTDDVASFVPDVSIAITRTTTIEAAPEEVPE